MAKCKHRIGDGFAKWSCGARLGRSSGCDVREYIASFVECNVPDGEWKTAFLSRYRRETKELCQKDCGWSGHQRRRRLCGRAAEPASKRKAVRLGFAAVGSRPFVSPSSFVSVRNPRTIAEVGCECGSDFNHPPS